MTSSLDKLNLRPFEKRLVVGVGVVLFVVLNLWFVVPHFSDLSQAKERRADAIRKLDRWKAEIDQASKYQSGINVFIKEGLEVPPEDQVNQFARAIRISRRGAAWASSNSGRPRRKPTSSFWS